jgi:hypothetical protein
MSYSRIAENNQQSLKKIYSDNSREWVSVYFKEAFTENTILYNIPILWTMEQFINIVKEWIMDDFIRIRRNNNNTSYSINLIEMCKEIPDTRPEDACQLEDDDETNQISYYDKYILNNNFPGFYIKISEN